MKIVDGVVYTQVENSDLRVIDVEILKDLCLIVEFSNGEKRIFDASKLLEYPVYEKLKDKGIFNSVDVKNGVLKLLKSVVKDCTLTALGVTSFGETFAMLDENDNILAPSMLYTDPRGEQECKWLCDAIGKDKLTLLTGVEPHQMYSIYKIMWHKNHNNEAFSKCKKILLGEDFIVYTLTKIFQ